MRRATPLVTGSAPDRSPALGTRRTGDGSIRAVITGTRAPERPIRADTAAAIAATRDGAFHLAIAQGGAIAAMYGGDRAWVAHREAVRRGRRCEICTKLGIGAA